MNNFFPNPWKITLRTTEYNCWRGKLQKHHRAMYFHGCSLSHHLCFLEGFQRHLLRWMPVWGPQLPALVSKPLPTPPDTSQLISCPSRQVAGACHGPTTSWGTETKPRWRSPHAHGAQKALPWLGRPWGGSALTGQAQEAGAAWVPHEELSDPDNVLLKSFFPCQVLLVQTWKLSP